MLWFGYTLEDLRNPFSDFLFVLPYESQEQMDMILEDECALHVFEPFEAQSEKEAFERMRGDKNVRIAR